MTKQKGGLWADIFQKQRRDWGNIHPAIKAIPNKKKYTRKEKHKKERIIIMKSHIALTKGQARDISAEHTKMDIPPDELQEEINKKILEVAYSGKYGFTVQGNDEFIRNLIQYREFYRRLGFQVEVRESFEYGKVILFSWRSV